MKSENALTNYTNAQKALMGWQKDHPEVFGENKRLLLAMIDAENDLRDAVAEENAEVSNRYFAVKIIPQNVKVYDEEKIKSKNYQSIDEVMTVKARPPRITISEIKQD